MWWYMAIILHFSGTDWKTRRSRKSLTIMSTGGHLGLKGWGEPESGKNQNPSSTPSKNSGMTIHICNSSTVLWGAHDNLTSYVSFRSVRPCLKGDDCIPLNNALPPPPKKPTRQPWYKLSDVVKYFFSYQKFNIYPVLSLNCECPNTFCSLN